MNIALEANICNIYAMEAQSFLYDPLEDRSEYDVTLEGFSDALKKAGNMVGAFFKKVGNTITAFFQRFSAIFTGSGNVKGKPGVKKDALGNYYYYPGVWMKVKSIFSKETRNLLRIAQATSNYLNSINQEKRDLKEYNDSINAFYGNPKDDEEAAKFKESANELMREITGISKETPKLIDSTQAVNLAGATFKDFKVLFKQIIAYKPVAEKIQQAEAKGLKKPGTIARALGHIGSFFAKIGKVVNLFFRCVGACFKKKEKPANNTPNNQSSTSNNEV